MMLESRQLNRTEGRHRVRKMMEGEIRASYPALSRKQIRSLAAETTKQAARNLRVGASGGMTVTRYPLGRWQYLKERFAPKWFLRWFPVHYVEV